MARDEAGAGLQRVQDADVVTAEVLLVAGEQDDGCSKDREDEEVNHPVERDQTEHVPVPEWAAPQRQLDLVASRWEPVRWRFGRRQWQPRIAPEAPVPPQAVRLTNQQVILPAHFCCICADEFVAVETAADELPAQFGSKAPGPLGARQPGQLRSLARARLDRPLRGLCHRVVTSHHTGQSRS